MDKPIIVYKRKSRGQVLGEFPGTAEFIEAERRASHEPRAVISAKVWKILVGEYKEMYSVHFQEFITIRVKHERNKIQSVESVQKRNV